MTALPYLSGTAHFDDRPPAPVMADQRDQHRAVLAPVDGGAGVDPNRDPIGFLRASAWAFLVRAGILDCSWPAFDANCSFVVPAEVPAEADPTTAVPGE